MTAVSTLILIGQATLVVGSIAYQQKMQRKMRKQARQAAEERKGFELVVEGEMGSLGIPMGRFKIGGFRVFRNTSNSFVYTAPNSNKRFNSGSSDIPAGSYLEITSNEGGVQTTQVNYSAKSGSGLTKSMTGNKNEYLFTQQALCVGPIHAVYDFLIDDSIDLNDPSLAPTVPGTFDSMMYAVAKPEGKGALRIDVHYGDQMRADAICAANFATRVEAKFPGLAYASSVFKLDRDDPQFQNIPAVALFGEGILAHSISNGVLSSVYSYTSNPARLLLWYLLHRRKLDVSEIDLVSFEAAQNICDRIVATVPVSGKIWQPLDGSRNVSLRNLPRYECCLILDTGKPHRENYSEILTTMGDARLVRSAGKYKLQLQDPATNDDIVFAGEITSKDIIQDGSFEINGPSSQDKLNHAVVRFLNESLDFKEDFASWPSKVSGTVLKGIGNAPYPSVDGWDEVHPGGKLLNTYGVWNGSAATATFTWKFLAKNTGTHTLTFTGDDNATVVIKGSTYTSSSWYGVVTATFNCTKDEIVTISVTAANPGGGKYGFAGRILDSQNLIVWHSRNIVYTSFIQQTLSNAVYQTYLAEDSGVESETDVFLNGVVTYHHAAAHAEELVRSSRSRLNLSFKYWILDKIYESGDYVKLNLPEFDIIDMPIKIDTSKPNPDGSCEITAESFDAANLAWNVADDRISPPRNYFNFNVPMPSSLEVVRANVYLENSSGRVTWAQSSDSRVKSHIIYVHKSQDSNANGEPIFVEIGRSSGNTFDLPKLAFVAGSVGVRAVAGNSVSDMAVTESILFNDRSVTLTQTSNGFTKDSSGVYQPASIELSVSTTGYLVPVIRWLEDDVVIMAQGSPYSQSSLTIQPFTSANKEYKVRVEEFNNLNDGSTLIEKSINLFSIDVGQPQTGGFSIDISPPAGALLTDSLGFVNDFSTANTKVTIYDANGLDKTTDFSFAKEDLGVVSSISPNGLLTISGYDPLIANPRAAGLILYCPFNTTRNDVSENAFEISDFYSGFSQSAPAILSGEGPYPGSSALFFSDLGDINYPRAPYFGSSNLFMMGKTNIEFNIWFKLSSNMGPYKILNLFQSDVLSIAFNGAWDSNDPNFFISSSFRFSTQPQGSSPDFLYYDKLSNALNPSTLPANVWHHLRCSFDAQNNTVYMHINGIPQTQSSTSSNPSYWSRKAISYSQGRTSWITIGGPTDWFYPRYFRGWLSDLSLERNVPVSSAPFTVPSGYKLATTPFALQASVKISATDPSNNVLVKSYPIVTTRATPPQVVMTLSPPSGFVDTDWNGVVTSHSNATVQLTTVSNGRDVTSECTYFAVATGNWEGIGINVSGNVISFSGWPASLTNKTFIIRCTHPTLPVQVAEYKITRQMSVRPVQTWRTSRGNLLSIDADADGVVSSGALAASGVSFTLLEDGADVTSSYTFNLLSSDSSITVVKTASNTFQLSSFLSSANNAVFTVRASKSNMPDVLMQMSVSKILAVRPAQTWQSSRGNVLNIDSDPNGFVPTQSLLATDTVFTIFDNGSDQTSSYSLAIDSVSSEITVRKLNANTFDVTSFSTAANNGIFSIRATKAGMPDVVMQISVNKVRALPSLSFNTFDLFQDAYAVSGVARSAFSINENGLIIGRRNNLSQRVVAAWSGTMTAPVQPSVIFIKATFENGSVAPTITTGQSYGVVYDLLQENSINFELAKSVNGYDDAQLLLEFFSDSNGNVKIGEGRLTLSVERG